MPGKTSRCAAEQTASFVPGVLRYVAAALCLVVAVAGGSAGQTPGTVPRAGAERAVPRAGADQAALYDLQRDEALGGHTLARHVGRTDEQLAERLRREPGISAASTYSDVLTARRVVGLAIEEARGRIRSWESRRGSRPNLVLNHVERGPAIGRSLARGARAPQPCTQALVVLRWLDRQNRWIVLTSYPEVRR